MTYIIYHLPSLSVARMFSLESNHGKTECNEAKAYSARCPTHCLWRHACFNDPLPRQCMYSKTHCPQACFTASPEHTFTQRHERQTLSLCGQGDRNWTPDIFVDPWRRYIVDLPVWAGQTVVARADSKSRYVLV